MSIWDKVFALPMSRRFWVAVGAVVVVLLNETLGIPEETAQLLVSIAIGWIVGDSLHKTGGDKRPSV